MSAEVVRFASVQPPTDGELVSALQWQESERALGIADSIAVYAYQKATVGDLPPDQAALCRALATHALRGCSSKWAEAAEQHANETCADALKDIFPWMNGPESTAAREHIGKLLAAFVISAYHGITEGHISLPMETYLKIARQDGVK